MKYTTCFTVEAVNEMADAIGWIYEQRDRPTPDHQSLIDRLTQLRGNDCREVFKLVSIVSRELQTPHAKPGQTLDDILGI